MKIPTPPPEDGNALVRALLEESQRQTVVLNDLRQVLRRLSTALALDPERAVVRREQVLALKGGFQQALANRRRK
ncbi:MAG: hypothetical protein OEV94_11955 [Deltaproteobacteria bacterium]|nr:hypothetical protein [Deltaproteobacteria bacterium]